MHDGADGRRQELNRIYRPELCAFQTSFEQFENALSDGPQSIYPAQFASMMDEMEQLAPIVGRQLARGIPVNAGSESK